MKLKYWLLYTYYIMFVKLYHWNYSGGQGPHVDQPWASRRFTKVYKYATTTLSGTYWGVLTYFILIITHNLTLYAPRIVLQYVY